MCVGPRCEDVKKGLPSIADKVVMGFFTAVHGHRLWRKHSKAEKIGPYAFFCVRICHGSFVLYNLWMRNETVSNYGNHAVIFRVSTGTI